MPDKVTRGVVYPLLGYLYALRSRRTFSFLHNEICLKGGRKMNKHDLRKIEALIGYEFNEPMLLKQAFTRRSYSQEHGGQNNENLEFFGDKVLDFIVTKRIATYFGEQCQNGSYITFGGESEGEFTKIKERLVERSMLAHRIDVLGLAGYLIMGKGDINKNVQNEDSVKEDLFEAIIGAVALDCEWDISTIQDVVETMLDIVYYFKNGFSDENHYVDLIQQWVQKNYNQVPLYDFEENDEGFECLLSLPDIDAEFSGEGFSKSSARLNAAAAAYEYLEENDLLSTIRDEIGEPCEERAINQLQELAQKGYINFPYYSFEEDHDDNGNPIWTCVCEIDGFDNCYENTCSSKKEAKRASAYEMLLEVLRNYIDEE